MELNGSVWIFLVVDGPRQGVEGLARFLELGGQQVRAGHAHIHGHLALRSSTLLLREGEAGDASLLPLSPGLGNVSQAEIERSMSVIGILLSHPADMSPLEDDEQDGSANHRNSSLVRKE